MSTLEAECLALAERTLFLCHQRLKEARETESYTFRLRALEDTLDDLTDQVLAFRAALKEGN